jgi:DNA (cytosine-5)-methyltransferase 1
MEKTFAEFFAGIGLMRMGLEQQGWAIRYANDIDQQKYEMYKGHFQDADSHFVLEDIHNIKGSTVPAVTLATASFPCNDLSLAGAREGLGGKQSSAFWEFIRILGEMQNQRPPFVLLENVLGFLNSRKGKDFEQALLALNQLGYSVDAFILDASSFTPQSRVRLFVVGTCESYALINEPAKAFQFFQSDVRPKALAEFIMMHSNIRWSLRDLPTPPGKTKLLEDIIEDLPDAASEWWSRERAEYLLNQMSPRHRKIADEMIAGTKWSYGTVFRRIRNGKSMGELRTDGLAGCLRTPRGGSGRQILFKAGSGRYFVRLITPREAARLMGTDDFNITASSNQALFGFGDAVCVPVIAWIAQHYLNPAFEMILLRSTPDEPPSYAIAGQS